ncbi:protein mono-ADP-ribosyltransferase PARP4-like, partial [Anneissia japonica]|uniref:protein mono-ADP-ribosyltransferase PARP4-like n=1 Tax=Anneissia japonica TaxID=1529436 RepID=UPI001425825A
QQQQQLLYNRSSTTTIALVTAAAADTASSSAATTTAAAATTEAATATTKTVAAATATTASVAAAAADTASLSAARTAAAAIEAAAAATTEAAAATTKSVAAATSYAAATATTASVAVDTSSAAAKNNSSNSYNFDELFPASQPVTNANISVAKTFIRNVQAKMGNTEVWRPLHAYFLLSDTNCLRNIFLISDGHINNEESTLNSIQLNAKNNRVFTFGISKTANKHLLRAIARVGTGAFEFFDTSTKSKWERKVKGQLLKARQPALSNVRVNWQQFDDNAPKPIQAPGQVTSLFSGSRQVVYGYVPFCRQATLRAEINGDEISTMVSTHELNVTEGKILHQLTARAIIRDWEDGTLDVDPVEHDIKKDAQKSYIIDLSKEYSIVTQFTSFVAIEERKESEVFDIFKPSISDLVAKENVDDIPYINWDQSFSKPKATAQASLIL